MDDAHATLHINGDHAGCVQNLLPWICFDLVRFQLANQGYPILCASSRAERYGSLEALLYSNRENASHLRAKIVRVSQKNWAGNAYIGPG